jgi:hypothetical protein
VEAMMRASVIRVENSERKGPYSTGVHEDLFGFDYNKRRQPTPFKDQLIFDEDCLFGFSGEDQLNSWFSEQELEALAEIGFRVVAYYDVIVVSQSKHQLVFTQ